MAKTRIFVMVAEQGLILTDWRGSCHIEGSSWHLELFRWHLELFRRHLARR
jgi:hypothetical protein